MMNTDKKEKELRQAEALDDGESSATEREASQEHRLSTEEIEQLKEQAAKAKENWDQMLRVAADLENFKKRAARERQEASKYANEALLQKLILVLDNFDMALSAANNAQSNTLQSSRTASA